MTLRNNAAAREWLYAVIFVTVGLVAAPVLFYSDSSVTSIWDDSTYTVTAFDKYWDDLVRYKDFERLWWKILMPYVSFLLVRAVVRRAKMLKKEGATAREN
jgi:hypothetical protein